MGEYQQQSAIVEAKQGAPINLLVLSLAYNTPILVCKSLTYKHPLHAMHHMTLLKYLCDCVVAPRAPETFAVRTNDTSCTTCTRIAKKAE